LLASSSNRFTPGEGTSGTHWLEGWVGPRAGLNTMDEKNRTPDVHEWFVSIPTEVSGRLFYRLLYCGFYHCLSDVPVRNAVKNVVMSEYLVFRSRFKPENPKQEFSPLVSF
jgi:hypothetical protein